MIKSHQKAVHTNGYKINYRHTNSAYRKSGYNNYSKSGYNNYSKSGYNNHSNYSNYSKSGYNNHRNYGNYSRSGSDDHTDRRSSGWTMNDGWYANHNDRGYDNHTNSGGYTKSGYNNHTNSSAYSKSGYNNHTNSGYNNHSNSGYNNHTNTAAVNTTAETSRTPTNTTNKAPTAAGSAFSASRYYNSKSIKIVLDSITYTDDNTSAATKYRIYYQYCATQSGTYGNWTLLSEQTTKNYTWTATGLTAGWYKIGVTTYDNGSWSAIPSGSGWTYDHIENHPTNSVTASNNGTGYSNVRQDSTAYDTTYAAVSLPIRIYHYTAPTWNTDYYTKPNEDQVEGEVNNLLTAMGQTTITFTNRPIVSQFTIITWEDIQKMQQGTSTAYNLRKGTNPTYSTGGGQGEFIENQKIIDIQDLLTILGQGD